MTYRRVLVFSLMCGLANYIATAAGRWATATSAIPYGIGVALTVALFGCAFLAIKNGHPKKPPRQR